MTELIVKTAPGSVEGVRLQGGCVAWLGIPYAEPPLGPLRFRPPVPVQPWSGVRPAHAFGPASVQVYYPDMGPPTDFYDIPPAETPEVVGSEDCLTLNIWAPARDGKTRPVYIWIHGGANHLEGSRLPIYHGDTLAQQGDMIVCSLNYRLGLQGFMDVEPILGPDYRGAYTNGLKDQALALQWLFDNIAAFGGDPGRITLAGESAGGMDVSWHLASGRMRGKIKRAVVMSDVVGPAGLGGDGPEYRHDPATVRRISLDVMRGAGIDDRDLLLNAPAEELCRRTGQISYDAELFGLDGQFYPGLDGDICPAEPLSQVRAGAMAGIDLLIGYTNFEAGLWLTFDPDLDQADPAWVAERFGFLSAETQQAAVQAYARFFPHESPGVRALHMVSDCGFTLPNTLWADAAAAAGSRVWMYRFDLEVNEKLRAMHAADLPFFFARCDSPPAHDLIGAPRDATDLASRLRLEQGMAGALISFVHTGAPASPVLPDWPQYDAGLGATMILNHSCHLAHHPLGARKAFWQDTLVAGFTGQNKL